MEKKKLCFVSHGLSSNGIEVLLVNIVRNLDPDKFDVTFIVALDPDVVPLHEPTVCSLGIRVLHICDLDSASKKVKYYKELSRILKEEKFDIVHANMDMLNGFVLRAAKRAGVPVRISHAHTSGTSQSTAGRFASVKKAIRAVYHGLMRSWICGTATDLLMCSEVAGRYMFGKRRKDAKMIHNGVDTAVYLRARQEALPAPGVDGAGIRMASVGRVSEVKNPLFAAQVVKALSERRQDFTFYWAGEGDLLESLRQKIRDLGIEDYFVTLGRRDDVPQFLSACSYFLMPSLFEGFPIALIEAQAAGLQCFVSDTVTQDADLGCAAFLPLSKGAEYWAQQIDEAMRTSQTKQADPDKLRMYDIRNTVSELEKIYLK